MTAVWRQLWDCERAGGTAQPQNRFEERKERTEGIRANRLSSELLGEPVDGEPYQQGERMTRWRRQWGARKREPVEGVPVGQAKAEQDP